MDQIKTTKIPPLDTATVQELFIEIQKRTRNCILIFSIDGKAAGDKESGYLYSGSISEVIGLLHYGDVAINHALQEDLIRNSEE